MEWEAPGIILDLRPLGEGDSVATVMTEAHGTHRGLARGAQSRSRAALWQPGNLVQLRWVGRLEEQLGSLTAEMVHPAASLVMEDRLLLGMLTAACAVAAGALIEREPQPVVFGGLLRLLARLPAGPQMLNEHIRWELSLLAALGFGLDLSHCAVTGETVDLPYVSPRTGRAVSTAAAGVWRDRLLPLPAFLRDNSEGDLPAWRDGLRLTGTFIERDAFGSHHRPLPQARQALYDMVQALAEGRS